MWFRRRRKDGGFKGLGIVNDDEPASAPEAVDDGSFMVRVWVHERAGDRVQFIHPDTVMDMLRGMMHGPAAPTFCDQFELAMRRMLTEARGETFPSELAKQPEVATVGERAREESVGA